MHHRPPHILVFPSGNDASSIAQAISGVDARIDVLVPATADEALDIMRRPPAPCKTAPPDLAVIILTSSDTPAWRVLCDAKESPDTCVIPLMALISPGSDDLAHAAYAVYANGCVVAPTTPEGWHDLARTLISFWGETVERIVWMP